MYTQLKVEENYVRYYQSFVGNLYFPTVKVAVCWRAVLMRNREDDVIALPSM